MDNLVGKSVCVGVCTQVFLTVNKCRLGRLKFSPIHPRMNENVYVSDPVILKLFSIRGDSRVHSSPLLT